MQALLQLLLLLLLLCQCQTGSCFLTPLPPFYPRKLTRKRGLTPLNFGLGSERPWCSNHEVNEWTRKAIVMSLVTQEGGGVYSEGDGEGATEASPLKQMIMEYFCDQVPSEALSEYLMELGACSVVVSVVKEKALPSPIEWARLAYGSTWEAARIQAYFPVSFDLTLVKELTTEFLGEAVLIDEAVRPVEDMDWVAHVQQTWKPFHVGNDLVIMFPWHLEDPKFVREAELKKTIVLEGGAGFGTGDHPTTRLCLRWLETTLSSMLTPKVLDYGCGSGILGLAAGLFKAGYIACTDIDKDSLVSAGRNAKRNSIHLELFAVKDADDEGNSIAMNQFKGGSHSFKDAAQLPADIFDVTVANILAPTIIRLCPTFALHTRTGGLLAVSGVLLSQAPAVMEAMCQHFNDVQIAEVEDEWVLLTGVKA